ncbi:hypothetical protein MRB53_038597 [Persea americana]|nr:hypothetical protein MRB53_038597 [Persea americana]
MVPSICLLRPRAQQRLSARSTARSPVVDLSLLHDSRFIALLITGTIAMTGFLPRYFLVAPSAVERGISASYAAWLLGLMNGLSVIGRLGTGWMADRYGKVNLLCASFILCGIGHFAFWLPGVAVSHGKDTTIALFTMFSVFVGLLGSGFVSLLPVVVAHLFGARHLASKVGLLNTVTGVGVLAGPSACLAIVGNGTEKGWSLGVMTAGLFMVIGGVVMLGSVGREGEHRTKRPDSIEMRPVRSVSQGD